MMINKHASSLQFLTNVAVFVLFRNLKALYSILRFLNVNYNRLEIICADNFF